MKPMVPAPAAPASEAAATVAASPAGVLLAAGVGNLANGLVTVKRHVQHEIFVELFFGDWAVGGGLL